MGYVITKKTAPWATKREEQLRKSEIDIGAALEELEKVPGDLRAGADLMNDQPDSEVMRSYANDVEKLYKDLKKTFDDMVKDRKAIQKGIRKYKEARHDWSV